MQATATTELMQRRWLLHRPRVLGLAHGLLGLLPVQDPAITIHGRDLRPADEGVGAQFQYVAGPRVFVVEVRVTQPAHALHFDVLGQGISLNDGRPIPGSAVSTTTLPIGDETALRTCFAAQLLPLAIEWLAGDHD